MRIPSTLRALAAILAFAPLALAAEVAPPIAPAAATTQAAGPEMKSALQ
ncbi:MAG: hypothetical protein ACKPEA_18395 [Planctomycetota bacterium]